MRHPWLNLLVCCSVPLALACRGRAEAGQNAERDTSAMTSDTTQGMMRSDTMRSDTTQPTPQGIQRRNTMQADTTRANRPRTTPGASANIALGRDIFEGKVAGGICSTCHGQNAEGTAAAPNLNDHQFLNGDGSLKFIEQTVREGVAKPKEHPAPMPPFKNVLTNEQIRAVSQYVYSLSHKHVQ
jgi:cbb3-type cytochrome c oxidase subunit III